MVAVALFVVEITQQVEPAIALLLMFLTLAVLAEVHLKQVLVEVTTQVDSIAELLMEALQAVELMMDAPLEVEA